MQTSGFYDAPIKDQYNDIDEEEDTETKKDRYNENDEEENTQTRKTISTGMCICRGDYDSQSPTRHFEDQLTYLSNHSLCGSDIKDRSKSPDVRSLVNSYYLHCII